MAKTKMMARLGRASPAATLTASLGLARPAVPKERSMCPSSLWVVPPSPWTVPAECTKLPMRPKIVARMSQFVAMLPWMALAALLGWARPAVT